MAMGSAYHHADAVKTPGCPARQLLVPMRLFLLMLAGVPAMLCAQARSAEEIASLRSEVSSLQQLVAAQAAQIEALQAQLGSLARRLDNQQAEVAALVPPPPAEEPDVVEVREEERGAAPAAVPPLTPKLPVMRSKWDVVLYGYAKLDASWDSQQTAAGNLAFYVLPDDPDTGGGDGEFNMTAKQTRLGLRIDGPQLADADVGGRVEIDFYGSASENAPNPRLRLAYMTFERKGWAMLAGQDYDPSKTVLPKTLNFATFGTHGTLWSRRPQLTLAYAHDLSDGLNLTSKFGLTRTIGSDLDGLGQEDGADSEFPTVQGNLILSHLLPNGQRGTISISGHYGEETIDSPTAEDFRDYETWMMMLSFRYPLTSRLVTLGTLWTGANLDNFNGGIRQGVNTAFGDVIAARGGWVQLQWKASDKLNLNLGGGLDDPDDDDLSPGMRARNANFSFSGYYEFVPGLIGAGEYSWIETAYEGAGEETAHRLQGALIYQF